ncbi:hypothetical protein K457DRAFT_120781 [Linnemannia elongata AG-77]|uniref:Uncharacterized protein n=1 Tax=Linnemannia elongata AG-77 TaxID=1314771 RepID=A0A197KD03_9FUNG|nr:hypothetical protein K457DRAFT_120781 [Linnemannia elongata AG-77]
MTRSETELRKQSRYNYVQEKYHEWCHDNKLDPYIANPSNVLNFLAWGHSTKTSFLHPTMSSLRYNPLIRHIKSPKVKISSQRISKHIAAITSRVDFPPDYRLPKAHAAGSTHAAKNGVSVDDIVVQATGLLAIACLQQ